MLDIEESSLVKGTAASLFVNLLKYRTDNSLHSLVWPKCKEKPLNPKATGFDLICEIIQKQQLLEKTREALELFVPQIYSDPNEHIQLLTPPGSVIHLCNIFISIFDVRTHYKFSDTEINTLDSFIR